SGESAHFGCGNGSELGELEVASAPGGSRAHEIHLAVDECDVAALRDDDVLAGELVFDTDGSATGGNAHCAGGVNAGCGVLGSVADGNWLSLDLRGVESESGLVVDVGVNGAGVEGNGESAARFEQGKMRGGADGDLAAFDEVDARGAGFHANVSTASQ